MRGREARKRMKEQEAAAVKIQARIRGVEARAHADARRNQSCT